jgi:lipopolysaccharide/colanic/teichoic acid biosynthesis glycosyltransferase
VSWPPLAATRREEIDVSLIDSHETVLERPRLSTATLGWQVPHYVVPQHSRPIAAPVLLSDRYAAAKRRIDVVVSLLALAAHLPLLLLIAIAIKLDSPGPVVFRQQRIGLHGRPFEMLKFRTMQHRPPHWPPDHGRLRQTCPNDPRVTRVGALLRHMSFDELPQLWNVLRGEMSLVGPRPHAPGTCVGSIPFEQVTERYAQRHQVRPGMTGLAQVRGWRGQTDTEQKLISRLDSDLEYIATWSLWLDGVILARTVATVLRMRNAY